MTTPFLSLSRLYFRSVYGLSGKKAAAKPELKYVLKMIGIGLLAILVTADIGIIFVASNLSMYEALKPQGLQGLLLLNSATSAAMIVFVLGFATALSTYCMSAMETGLLAMPVKPRHLLGAKFLMVYLSEFLFGSLLVGISVVIFGIREGPPAVFYLAGALVALATPLVPLAFAYLIIVPLMSGIRAIRNKNALMVIGGVVGLSFALLFNFYIQSATARMNDPVWILANYAGPESLIARIGIAYPPSYAAWKTLALCATPGKGVLGLLVGLAGLAAGIVAAGGSVLLLAGPYAKSLSDFGELSLKRLTRAGARSLLDRTMRRKIPIVRLLGREWKLMNREPAYFLNGPFTVILGPIIMGVIYFAQRETYMQLVGSLDAFKASSYAMLAVAAFGTFLGSATSITCTALSRDAKALAYIKALPIDPVAYMGAKFLHGFVVSVAGCAIGALGGAILLGLPALEALGALAIALSAAALIDLVGLWLDTINPRLSWDNPIAALKQNPNSVIVILGVMGLLGGLGALAYVLPMGKAAAATVFGGAPALLFLLAWLPYPAYARKKIASIDA